ncbi:MAG: acyl-CoA dehydrogenase [Dehalococcoidia bacterium]|jgi:alkylation response protein AidB-like acyl-CoA dehydrogenase|nr:acyl-CoA dehydrogenase [Dehalococcoidia bacterium]
MDFKFTPEEEAFRQEVRRFIKEELPPMPGDLGTLESEFDPQNFEFTKQVAKKLGDKKWLAMNWPKEYGGLEASPIENMIFKEEATYHQVPGIDMGVGGITWVGPTLLILGNEDQKREHLPPLAAGEKWWCTMYSEPGAGSDMSNVMCRAVLQGDEYIINGQKVWTSAAHIADWGWMLVKTDPDAPKKHHGISLLLVDMKTPGITVRPLLNMAGHLFFNEVFFDNVHVPKRNLIGEENRGWYYTMIAMAFERTMGVVFAAGAQRLLDELVGFAKGTIVNGLPLSKNPSIRQNLADLAIEVEIARVIGYRIVWQQIKGELPGYEAPMIKVFASETLQRMTDVGTQIMGLYGQLWLGSKWAPLHGMMADTYMNSAGMLIAAGTSEILRNIIAERGLGLPRSG